MVPDEIDYSDGRFALSRTQTPAQLLEEHDAGLCRPQQHDAVYRGDIDAFVEYVNGANCIQFTPAETS